MNEVEFNTFLNLCQEIQLCDDKDAWTCCPHFPTDSPSKLTPACTTFCEIRLIRNILLNPALSTAQKIEATLHYLLIYNQGCIFDGKQTLSELLKCDCRDGFPCLLVRALKVVFENQSTWNKDLQSTEPNSNNKKEGL
ncbi:MAG: hypothetical protein LBH79_07550 [Nitrososphaerota archaeon]|jgi:hypothetical protein|nr:hypothetical protein [Nitrososphaerota archaeon]